MDAHQTAAYESWKTYRTAVDAYEANPTDTNRHTVETTCTAWQTASDASFTHMRNHNYR